VLRDSKDAGYLNTVCRLAGSAYCLAIACKEQSFMSTMGQSENVDYFSVMSALLEAPGFDFDTPLQFRLFDPQICSELQEDWLAQAVEAHGVTRAELKEMIANGLVKRWENGAGASGFLLYSEQQARLAKKLQTGGRHSLPELQHIFNEWNAHLEMLTCDELAYDSYDIDDYEHYRRRAVELADFFAEDLVRMETHGDLWASPEDLTRHKERARKQHREWARTRDYLASRSDTELTPQMRQNWRKSLHQIRFADEHARLITANAFVAQIEQGYSPEVVFQGWEIKDFSETTFGRPNWHATLHRFKETRKEGKAFPLRTPDFDLTEKGIELLGTPSPDDYKALHEKYFLGELTALINKRGSSLWVCDLEASGRGACVVCNGIFERTTASRLYCSERCRNRAKSQRYRESDPERARRAQARHYRDAYPEV
jgi:hypothetical protein